ncbi:MAG: hypothetical protein ABIC39_00315 [Pseudomonadota bacterium]
MKKKRWFLILTVLFLISGKAFSGQGDVAKIIKMAKQEGKVTWTSTLKDKEAKPFVKAFNKEYPTIKVAHTRASGGPSYGKACEGISKWRGVSR